MTQAQTLLSQEDIEFLRIYNNRTDYPSTEAVAEKLGLAVQTVKNRAVQLRKRALEGLPIQVISRLHHSVPASEDPSRYRANYTRDDCIEELRRVAALDPDRPVSRNFFRVHSKISDSTWNKFFGTFEEFKRQASLKLTRQQHGLERAIAKHASVDHYRAMNVERQDYGNRYDRPLGSRYRTIVLCSDLHDEDMDPFFRRVLVDTVRRVQPDVFSVVGDGFDLPEFGKYGVDPREWNVIGRIRYMHGFLEELRNAAPDAQLDWIEGNHEFRLLRHLADQTPALKAVLADLHGMTVRQLLGLDRYEVNYIAKADLAAFTQRDVTREIGKSYKVYNDCLLAYHFPDGRSMGLPGVNGHHHKHIVWSEFSPIYGAYEWHQMGCGHRRDASYCRGEKWHMGFMIANLDTHTRQVNFDYVPVTDFAVAGGKWYHRAANEVVANDGRLLQSA